MWDLRDLRSNGGRGSWRRKMKETLMLDRIVCARRRDNDKNKQWEHLAPVSPVSSLAPVSPVSALAPDSLSHTPNPLPPWNFG